MNVRRAAVAVAAGVLLTVGLAATPAYAEGVDLKALPATATGAAGETIPVTIAYDVSVPLWGSPPVMRIDITLPSGAFVKEHSPQCILPAPRNQCPLKAQTPGRHELVFQVVMSNAAIATGSFTLTITAPGWTDTAPDNNTASITLKQKSSASPSPTASKKPSPTPTPKASKRSATASPTTEETDAAAPTDGTPTGDASATGVSVVSAAGNDDSSSLPVVIFGGAGALVVVGGFLLWVVLRRRSDEDDDDDEYADERFDRYR